MALADGTGIHCSFSVKWVIDAGFCDAQRTFNSTVIPDCTVRRMVRMPHAEARSGLICKTAGRVVTQFLLHSLF